MAEKTIFSWHYTENCHSTVESLLLAGIPMMDAIREILSCRHEFSKAEAFQKSILHLNTHAAFVGYDITVGIDNRSKNATVHLVSKDAVLFFADHLKSILEYVSDDTIIYADHAKNQDGALLNRISFLFELEDEFVDLLYGDDRTESKLNIGET